MSKEITKLTKKIKTLTAQSNLLRDRVKSRDAEIVSLKSEITQLKQILENSEYLSLERSKKINEVDESCSVKCPLSAGKIKL